MLRNWLAEASSKKEARRGRRGASLMPTPCSPESGGEVGYDTAERWLTGLQETVAEEAELQGGPLVLQRSESEDSIPERARYVLRFRTAGRRSSPWEVVYELHDTDDDKVLDTLRVVAVLPGARER
ncbi:MAG: hypothetical protein H7145_08930 [Akkermansiaceae bacterium]|nr:hypothetical protein [Armatimonadota bacterium]